MEKIIVIPLIYKLKVQHLRAKNKNYLIFRLTIHIVVIEIHLFIKVITAPKAQIH